MDVGKGREQDAEASRRDSRRGRRSHSVVGWMKERSDDGQDSPSVAEHMDV